ncbi:hypothetical protein N431DRAFT_425097 [Stipitochalara longipes BDJ]|nr:hypothetical protein N431DRAFT_425097 [Stipitochalara longipes BDJ]
MSAVSAMPGLPAAARETAILATGSHYQAPYEIYAHERVALAKTSLSKEQINMIKKRKKPRDLREEESVAFDASMELVSRKGPLGKERWDEVVDTFGIESAAALVQYVGLYAYAFVFLNAGDMQLPEGEKIWE